MSRSRHKGGQNRLPTPPYDTIGCASLRSAHPIKVTEIDNIVIAVGLSY